MMMIMTMHLNSSTWILNSGRLKLNKKWVYSFYIIIFLNICLGLFVIVYEAEWLLVKMKCLKKLLCIAAFAPYKDRDDGSWMRLRLQSPHFNNLTVFFQEERHSKNEYIEKCLWKKKDSDVMKGVLFQRTDETSIHFSITRRKFSRFWWVIVFPTLAQNHCWED